MYALLAVDDGGGVREGLIVGGSNPKELLIFGAVLPQVPASGRDAANGVRGSGFPR